ncbi:MAG: type II toxin-antitoxin system VapC family toxin [Pirellulales bacterium]|nr:type II toxin-antitoxin system VapC family toxin [Pirellulales bacterium]
MTSLVLDTHSVIWYLNNSPRLSITARQAIRSAIENGFPVYVSAISIAKVVYLAEKGRLAREDLEALLIAIHRSDSGLVALPFDMALAEMLPKVPRDIVPDMPDRIIAVTALALNLPLVTIDSRITKTSIPILW